jgi:ferredoxin
MRIKVDANACTGHGRCYVLAPEVYSADAEGFNAAIGGVIDVPEGLEEAAIFGLESCPEAALTVEPEHHGAAE